MGAIELVGFEKGLIAISNGFLNILRPSIEIPNDAPG